MKDAKEYYYNRLHFGYFDLKKYLKHLTPNEQAYVISKYGRTMRYEDIMEKFNLNLFQLNIIRHSAELKMTLLLAKQLLPYQQLEVEQIKKAIYPEITEEEYDNYVWDVNEDLTKAYYSGCFDKEYKKSNKGPVDQKEELVSTKENEDITEVRQDRRRKVIEITEVEKQKVIDHFKYFTPLQQMCLIYSYQLFGEDNLTLIGIASKFNCSMSNVSQLKKKALDIVNKYILTNSKEAEKYFANLESKGKVYDVVRENNDIPHTVATNEEKIAEQEDGSSVEQEKDISTNNRDERHEKIVQHLKHFTKAEQICLVYGLGLFGVEKGGEKAIAKHFKKGFNVKEVFLRTMRKMRLILKPIKEMNATEYAMYQQLLENNYKVLDKTFFNPTKVETKKFTTDIKEKQIAEKPNHLANLITKDINLLSYFPHHIQYVLLSISGLYGEKIPQVELSKKLNYSPQQISKFKSDGIKNLEILHKNQTPELFIGNETDIYNSLIKHNYSVLTEEEFKEFDKTFTKSVKEKVKEDKQKAKNKNMLALPEHFDIADLIHFGIKEQVIMYLVFGLEETKPYSLVKVQEAVKMGPKGLRDTITQTLETCKILHTPYEELDDEQKKIYNEVVNKHYLQITKENLYDWIPNKNSEIYFEEKGYNV